MRVANGIPNESTICESNGTVSGCTAQADDRRRRRHGDAAADEQWDAPAQEALHDDLAGVGAHAGGGEPRGQERGGERRCGTAADEPAPTGACIERAVPHAIVITNF